MPLKAGDDHDEGAGLLANASTTLELGDPTPDKLADSRRPAARAGYTYGGDMYGGDPYGGGAYGGDPYGGTSYAHWTMPTWSYQPPNRAPRYTIASSGLDGAIEGTVTWPGAVPPRVATPCGTIENPSLHVGANHAARGVIVYIDHVTTGRQVPTFSKPVAVGGMIAKRGCVLEPAAQLAVPLPTSVAIHGDRDRTRVRITPAGGSPVLVDLQEAGIAHAEIRAGVTRIDAEDGKLAAAWVVGLDTPYYAITDDAGRYRIEELAPGSYEVTFWQAPIATAGPEGTLVYGAPIVVRRAVRVTASHAASLSVALPSR
jgi:hypothetical protein